MLILITMSWVLKTFWSCFVFFKAKLRQDSNMGSKQKYSRLLHFWVQTINCCYFIFYFLLALNYTLLTSIITIFFSSISSTYKLMDVNSTILCFRLASVWLIWSVLWWKCVICLFVLFRCFFKLAKLRPVCKCFGSSIF